MIATDARRDRDDPRHRALVDRPLMYPASAGLECVGGGEELPLLVEGVERPGRPHGLVRLGVERTSGHDALLSLLRELVDAGGKHGVVRDDIPSDELATYCAHALSAARRMRSPAAVERLVILTLSGLRPV